MTSSSKRGRDPDHGDEAEEKEMIPSEREEESASSSDFCNEKTDTCLTV
jgi:hypothetical protein